MDHLVQCEGWWEVTLPPSLHNPMRAAAFLGAAALGLLAAVALVASGAGTASPATRASVQPSLLLQRGFVRRARRFQGLEEAPAEEGAEEEEEEEPKP